MGVISLDRADSLFWLGRYTERVFTTVKEFFDYYDRMIDQNEDAYKRFCMKLSIPDVYGNHENFVKDYILDEENPDSIISNMKRAYDNAIVSRDDVSTESMAYLELCLQAIRREKGSPAPVFELQSVIDDIYAFWGSIDDCVLDEENRNIIIEIDKNETGDLPEGYFWADYKTLNRFISVNNCLNIQLRNLLSVLEW